MHKFCTRLCFISEACNTSILSLILLQWIWDNQNTNKLRLHSCSLSPFIEIGLSFIHRAFFPILCLYMAPSQEPILHLTFGEPWWSSEILWTSPSGWSSSSCPLDLLRVDLHQVDHLVIHNPLMYLMIPRINMLRPLVIPVILREMYSTLTVAMNPNWILHYTKVSTNPLNHKASFDASTTTMYSVSVVERATVSCNSVFQTHLATMNI